MITDNEIERIESMLSMVNLAVSEIIENGRVKRLPAEKRKKQRAVAPNRSRRQIHLGMLSNRGGYIALLRIGVNPLASIPLADARGIFTLLRGPANILRGRPANIVVTHTG